MAIEICIFDQTGAMKSKKPSTTKTPKVKKYNTNPLPVMTTGPDPIYYNGKKVKGAPVSIIR